MLNPQLEKELRNDFAQAGQSIETPDGLTERLLGHDYRPRAPHRRLYAVSGGLALVVVVAFVTFVVVSWPKTEHRLATSGGALQQHLALRLVDNQVTLVSGNSLAATGGVSAISCSSASSCIAVGTASQHSGGFVATTTDGGLSWSEQPLPAGLSSLSALSCSTAYQCVAAGTRTSGAAIVATTDGGHSWSYLDLPDGVSSLTSVSCAADRCWAVGSGSKGASLLNGSPDAPWTFGLIPRAVTTLSAVGCTAGAGAPTCMAVGSAGSAPAVIATIAGAPWASLATPSGAQGLASAACTNASAPTCTTLVQEGNHWVEASRFVASVGLAGEWHLPQIGGTVPTGTVLAGVSDCIAIGGPSCTPSNANLVDTVTAVISSLSGEPSTPGPPGSLNESLTSGYISSEPSFSQTSSSEGAVSPVWYMGVSENGFSANEVLTPAERIEMLNP